MAATEPFQWDRENLAHIARHSVAPGEAVQVFCNLPVELDPEVINDEERFKIYGETNTGRLLAVVYTVRESRIRVVTAFDLDGRQKRQYLRTKARWLENREPR